MAADTYLDHPGRMDGPGEYWHMDTDDDGHGGPFATLEEAKADAEKYLHSQRFRLTTLKIVKVVAVSETEVAYRTQWNDA